MKFLFHNLQSQNTAIARDLSDALKRRIGEDITPTEELPLSTKKSCAALAADLYVRYFHVESFTDTAQQYELEAVVVNEYRTAADHMNIEEQMFAAVRKESETHLKTFASTSVEYAKKEIKHELAGYEKYALLGENLRKILNTIKNIQPTSTESERMFSLASHIC